MNRNLLPLALSLFVLISCASEQDQQGNIERPFQPWVVRSVLDSTPRMLTIALDQNLWVAYNTGHCGLSRAWKGHIDFDGAVYTTAHGPQPLSVGDAFVVDTIVQPWQIYRGDAAIPTKATYAGHRITDGHAILMYTLNAEGLSPITVYERVEYYTPANGQPGLERVFWTEGLSAGHQVRLHTQISSIVSQRNIETNGTLTMRNESSRAYGNLQILDLDGDLALRSDGETHFTVCFVNRPTIRNPNGSGLEEDVTLPLGQRLIERSDCKTCHNMSLRTIGPSFTEIALRYPNGDESVSLLSQKIIKGGAGIWGAQVMSPHPDLSDTDCREIVGFILSLDTLETAGGRATVEVGDFISPVVSVKEDELLPGAVTRVYEYNRDLTKIPVQTGKPKMGGIMANFDNLEGSKFVGLTDNFSVHAEGFLHVPERGVYVYQLWSDDGSRFSLNNKLLIDHDGPHGTSAVEKAVALEAGYYPYTLEYYQGAGGKFLSLDWKRPGLDAYEVIPASLFFHSGDQRSLTSGLTLPMSALTRVPGDQFPLAAVHPGYDLFQARPYDFLPKVGGMDFMSDGTLVICTWDPTGSVYLIRNHTASNPADIVVKEIAFGLAEPLGLKVVDDEIYVLQKQELTKLIDLDGDEVIDEYRNISNQWQTSGNFHEFAFGLAYRDGYFYANLAIAIQPGGASTPKQIQDRGKVMKISRETGAVDFIASGLRTPNGIGWGVDDELFVADNQGDWLPSSKILHVSKGDWFGSRAVDFEGTANLKEKPPVVWLPQDEIGNSPSTPGILKTGPYAGQMIHGEVTHGGIKRVFVEKINGVYQGVVFRFIQGLESGVNRSVVAPDGSIYIGGVGSTGNWGHAGKLWYGLQRLTPNGKSAFEMLAVRAKSDGMEIEFTEPLRESEGWLPSDYEIKKWRYVPTENYGGPKIDEKAMTVKSAHVSNDRKRVFLAIDGLKSGHVVYLRLRNKFVSAAGNGLWSTEAWYTLNQIPQNSPGDRIVQSTVYAPNTLTTEEVAQGWKLLFNGTSAEGWRNYGKQSLGASWIVQDGAIFLNAVKNPEGHWQAADGGDILTDGEYENFEFAIEWKISNCGNSGIIYNVVESDQYQYAWNTGPEMQILDNSCHPDSRFITHQAGDLYDLISSTYVTVKPAGEWNKVRIIKNKGHLEHWLNGVKVVECEMYSDRWKEMIANSKFKGIQGFGMAPKGKIVLQDHGDRVWFRNIKIREL
jgi:cytochrome c